MIRGFSASIVLTTSRSFTEFCDISVDLGFREPAPLPCLYSSVQTTCRGNFGLVVVLVVSYVVLTCRATHCLPAYGPPCTVGVLAGTHGGCHRVQGDSVAKRQTLRCGGWSRDVMWVVVFRVHVRISRSLCKLRILTYFLLPSFASPFLSASSSWSPRIRSPSFTCLVFASYRLIERGRRPSVSLSFTPVLFPRCPPLSWSHPFFCFPSSPFASEASSLVRGF